jgi:hypothetical protein
MTRAGHPAAFPFLCGEQDKLPAAKNKACRKGTSHMSEQEKPKSFMQELDEWTETHVAKPLLMANATPEYGWDSALEAVKKAIRTKVLESYRNGQQGSPRVAKKPQTGRQA